jgi:hypothetical protein
MWLELTYDVFFHSIEVVDPGDHEALGMYLINEINKRVVWDQRGLDEDEPGVVSGKFSTIGKIYGDLSPRAYTISPLDFFDTRIRMARLPNCPDNVYDMLVHGEETSVLSLAYIIEYYVEPENAVDEWGEFLQLAGERKDELLFNEIVGVSRGHILRAKDGADELFDDLYRARMYAGAMLDPQKVISHFDTIYKDKSKIFTEWRVPATLLCIENVNARKSCLDPVEEDIKKMLRSESIVVDKDDVYVDEQNSIAREELRLFFQDLLLLAVRQNRMDVVEEVLAHPVVQKEDIAEALHFIVEADRTHTTVRLSVEV